MNRRYRVSMVLVIAAILFASFTNDGQPQDYREIYKAGFARFRQRQERLLAGIAEANLADSNDVARVRALLGEARIAMKAVDLWSRYLEPLAYKQVNGPLPAEWETEVFEKYEQPYRRDGAGLTLAVLYLDGQLPVKDTLMRLVRASLAATSIYTQDSITKELGSHDHFYLCNRLFLLNLAAIYTTGFECPDEGWVIPELRAMLAATGAVYSAFNKSFPGARLNEKYLTLYGAMVDFVAAQPGEAERFDHYRFIKDFVAPLYGMNQAMILQYDVASHSLVDYSLNKKAVSIFDKALYRGQNAKGIFTRVTDSVALAEIEQMGRLLFYDPILSGNNMRSCASCHKPSQHFTDTMVAAAMHYNRSERLPRNTPSLVNVTYNHLLMLDGKHISLQAQGRDVISNHAEMMCREDEALKKVMSCAAYKRAFGKMLEYTPQEKEVTIEHIVSAIAIYCNKFSAGYSPFDRAMNGAGALDERAVAGFNLFMGKAQCGTCHFVPQFNGVKPPYVGSEFEVLGVPGDTGFTSLSADEGRYKVNPAPEMLHAFRTGTIRNAAHTAPYMHNGVFRTLEEVIDFYDAGGGAGRGLHVPNQTLAADSLRLTATEKKDIIAFIRALDEDILFEEAPAELPRSGMRALNGRKSGGEY